MLYYFYHVVPSKVTIRLIRPINVSGGLALGVVWSKPSHDSRLMTIEYRLQYRVAGQDEWSSSRTVKSQTLVVPNLPHSTTYQVRVRGVSVVGRYGLFGEWTAKSSTDSAGIVISINVVH